jgi:ribonuclease Z
METENRGSTDLTRREMLILSGAAVGELAVGGVMMGPLVGSAAAAKVCQDDACICPEGPACRWDHPVKPERYTYFEQLPPFYPYSNTPTTIPRLGADEMRITFMGSSIPPNMRRKQQMMSIFVEVGWDEARQMPLDHFIFDCGSGVCTNYAAMNVGFGRMDKVFLNHLHGDHMSDLTHIYCFGPSQDRQSPLYVWGAKDSGVLDPKFPGKLHADGIKAFCEHLRAACRWHSESFSFQPTSYTVDNDPRLDPPALQALWRLPCDPIPVGDPEAPDAHNDGYAMIPIELDWEKYGEVEGDNIAYHNQQTGVKITHFPVIHARRGSMGYKLEWTPPGNPDKTLSMIYSSDTKPEDHCIEQAKNGGKGVDVFIHEMIVPADVWAMKIKHLTEPVDPERPMVKQLIMVQNSSHTTQGAFGYLLSQIDPRPRLTVATHFPVADDTVECAMKSIMAHCNVVRGRDPKPKEDAARITWSFDCMVITVSKDGILEQRGEISEFNICATVQPPPATLNPAKYSYPNGVGNPYAQIDATMTVPACDPETGKCNYREDGY